MNQYEFVIEHAMCMCDEWRVGCAKKQPIIHTGRSKPNQMNQPTIFLDAPIESISVICQETFSNKEHDIKVYSVCFCTHKGEYPSTSQYIHTHIYTSRHTKKIK